MGAAGTAFGDREPRSRAIGGAGARISSGILADRDPNLELRGERWYGSPYEPGIAAKMTRDAHVRKSLEYIRGPILSGVWAFSPPEKSPLATEIADFCRYAFFERINFRRIARAGFRYLDYGVSILEATDDIEPIPANRFPQHPGSGRGLVFTDFHERPPWTIRGWNQSAARPDQLESVTQWIQGSDGEEPREVTIPANRLLRWTWDQEGADFSGIAVLRSAFGPWKMKHILTVIDGIRHDRQGAGIPLIAIPEGASEADVAAAEEILSEMRSHEQGYVLLPHGFAFRWENGDDLGTSLGESIERCNRDIAYNVGFGFMLLGTGGGKGTGSYALASTQDGAAQLGLDEHAAFYAASWNQAPDGWSPIRYLVEANYGVGAPIPRLVVRNLPTKDWSKYLPNLASLVQAGLLTPDNPTEDHLREAITLPPHDPDSTRATMFDATQRTAAKEAA